MKHAGFFSRLFLACLVISGLAFSPMAAVSAQPRHALVIGNADYKFSPLKNPANDAADMAQTLEKLGFNVIPLINATLLEMERGVRQFGKQLGKGGVGLFYYAGHGLQVDGRNYLVSVDAAIQEEFDIKYESLDAYFVLDVMDHSQSECNIMILDACRDNPFARSFRGTRGGLAKIDAPIGTIIAYATAPGQVAMDDGGGKNGLYTGYLLKNIQIEGLTIEEVFKRVRNEVAKDTANRQVPWESTSLRGTFCFNGCTGPPDTPSSPLPPGPGNNGEQIDKQMELAFWKAIEDSPDPDMFAAYLEKYPNGAFSPLAEIKMEKLKNQRAGKTLPTKPEARTAPKPESMARLTIEPIPSHASVVFANDDRSYAPNMPMEPGLHGFTVAAEGYAPKYQSVHLQKGTSKTVRVTLEKKQPDTAGTGGEPAPTAPEKTVETAPEGSRLPAIARIEDTLENMTRELQGVFKIHRPTALLSISGSPKGALVHVDGKQVGKLPLVDLQLEKGTHEICVSADGFFPEEAEIALDSNRELPFILREVRSGRKKIVMFPWNLKGAASAHVTTILNYLAQKLEKKGCFELLTSYYPLDNRFKKAEMESATAEKLEDVTWKRYSYFSNPYLDVAAVRDAAARLGADLAVTGELSVNGNGSDIYADLLKIYIIHVSDDRMRTLSINKRLNIHTGELSTELPALASDMLREKR